MNPISMNKSDIRTEYSYSDIKHLLPKSHEYYGNKGVKFTKLNVPSTADSRSLAFVSSDRLDKQKLVTETRAAIVICDRKIGINEVNLEERGILVVDDPKEVFSRVGNVLFVKMPTSAIHPSSWIHHEAELHPDVYIGPMCSIGRVKIESGCKLYGNIFIYDNVLIGKNVIIHAGTVIGAEGFGYNKNEKGEWENFPHVGSVIIEDNVEIGANTCIDRGSLGETRIKKGAKIDNLVHIAHNVTIGSNALIIADAMIGGSTQIGDLSWVAPSASIRDQLTIGQSATVGMGAVVTKNIPSGETWTGSPARPLREFLEIQKGLKALSK